MYRPRVIPVLLLKNQGLVKSKQFKDYRYIGDPINAVKIFNDLKADELVLLDITASVEHRSINQDFVSTVGEEANMPFSVGGGIRDLDTIRKTLEAGAEKVVINSMAIENPNFINSAAMEFGASTITVCIDIKRNLFGNKKVYRHLKKKFHNEGVVSYAKQMENLGAGELILQSVDLDGSMKGYDIPLITEISSQISIPLTALGGAGSIDDLKSLNQATVVNGFGAGSLFVYHGTRKAILVNYPNPKEIQSIVNND